MKAKRVVLGLSYVYIALPVMLFFIGWTKWWIAVPVCLLLFISFVRASFDKVDLWLPPIKKETVQLGILVLILIGLWVYFSGIGGKVAQSPDHYWRNTIFNILVEYDWPVQKELLRGGIIRNRVLIYYIGFWLPAAVVGKLFGLAAGYTFQMIWAVLGIFLVYIYITSFLKRMSALPMVVFILFNGLDYLGYFFTSVDVSGISWASHLETWNKYYQYSGFTTQLNWVFNQSIYAWLLVCLLLIQKSNRQIVLIWSCGLITATIPFVGLLPFLLYKMVDNGIRLYNIKGDRLKAVAKDLFTVENVCCGGCVGILSFLYLLGNGALKNAETVGGICENLIVAKGGTGVGVLGMIPNITTNLVSDPEVLGKNFWYILFLLLEVGVYFILIYRYQRNNILFYVTVITLCLVPKIQFGSYNEFCMRASIPALFVLFVLVMQSLYRIIDGRDWIRMAALLLALIIGARTALGEFMTNSVYTALMSHSEEGVRIQMVDEDSVFNAENFAGYEEGNFFFKYIAK